MGPLDNSIQRHRSEPQALSALSSSPPLLHEPSRDTNEEHEGLLNGEISFQPGTDIPDFEFIPAIETGLVAQRGDTAMARPEEKRDTSRKVERQVYWIIPFSVVLLFLLGLGAAVGHCVFFGMIKEKPVGGQTWTLRYSLALAFVFKSALAASISLALAQHAWLALRRSRKGTPVQAIDAMFSSGSSLLGFLSPSLWRSSMGTGLMAACIWLMPLTALVAPTALTVGTSVVNITEQSCTVPTLDWGVVRNFTTSTEARALFTSDYADVTFGPSADSERLTASVSENGRQTGWQSPCGPNCTYEIDFIGPSWQCTQVENVISLTAFPLLEMGASTSGNRRRAGGPCG